MSLNLKWDATTPADLDCGQQVKHAGHTDMCWEKRGQAVSKVRIYTVTNNKQHVLFTAW